MRPKIGLPVAVNEWVPSVGSVYSQVGCSSRTAEIKPSLTSMIAQPFASEVAAKVLLMSRLQFNKVPESKLAASSI